MLSQSSGFNSYAAGNKVYNGGSSAPTLGPVGIRSGTAAHQLSIQARRNALLRRLKAGQGGAMMSPDWLRGPNA